MPTKTVKVCNGCGCECNLCEDMFDVPVLGGLIDATVRGTYFSTPGNGSGALEDVTNYGFSLCEFCLDWLFQQFRLPPRVWPDGVSSWRPAKQRVLEDAGRTGKEEFFQEAARRDGLRGPSKS